MRPRLIVLGAVIAALALGCRGSAPKPEPAATPSLSVTATASATPPATPPPTPVAGRRTGVAEVDTVLAAVAAKDVDALLRLVALQEVTCIDPRTQGAGGPVRCAAGEAVGSNVRAFATSTCEGEWTREADLRAMVNRWLDGTDSSRGVYGVVRGPSIPRSEPYWPVGEYWAVYEAKASAPGPTESRAKVAVIEGGKLVALRFGCSLTPAEEMTFRGSALPVVLPALP